MCAPIATLAPIVSLASTVFSAVSTISNASAEAKATKMAAQNNRNIAEYNATVQERNAKLDRESAADAKNRGAQDAATIRENARKANARARVVSASKGLIADSGSNLDVLEQNAATGELSALTAMNNAEREAYGYDIQALDAETEARNLRFTGDVGVSNAAYKSSVTKQAGLYGAAGTLVTGAADFGYKYPDFLGQGKKKAS